MSGRGKRKDDEEFASDDDGGGGGGAPPPKKTLKKDSSSDDSDDVVVCEISKNRRVAVRNWQGRIFVDIREFYVKDGKQLPGKKGLFPWVPQEEEHFKWLQTIGAHVSHDVG